MNTRTIKDYRSAADANQSSKPTNLLKHYLGLLLAPLLMLEHWRRHQQVSMQFAHVDPRILRDAGISEAQRFIEINRPGE